MHNSISMIANPNDQGTMCIVIYNEKFDMYSKTNLDPNQIVNLHLYHSIQTRDCPIFHRLLERKYLNHPEWVVKSCNHYDENLVMANCHDFLAFLVRYCLQIHWFEWSKINKRPCYNLLQHLMNSSHDWHRDCIKIQEILEKSTSELIGRSHSAGFCRFPTRLMKGENLWYKKFLVSWIIQHKTENQPKLISN